MPAMKLPTLAGIEDALASIRPHVFETPLIRSELLSHLLDADVWLKNETVSPIASFKLRGALSHLIRARERGPVELVVTASTGNHGQGVAYAARLLGIEAHVFLPKGANPVKRSMIEILGGVLHEDHVIEEYKQEAQRYARDNGYPFVDDGDSFDLMEGAGTVGLEIGRALDGVDLFLVPVGDGSLISGSACALKGLQPGARVDGVQSKGAPAFTKSFHAGKVIPTPVHTIAEGLSSPLPSPLALEAAWAFVDDITTVEDDLLLAAMHTLVEAAHVLVEPAGAAPLVDAWARREDVRGKRVVLLLSGANLTADLLARALKAPPLIPQ